MDEIWKPIGGYEGLYEVSNLGRVKGLHSNKILSPKVNCRTGYVEVNLSRNGKGKTFRVHRLVAENFIPFGDKTLEVNHIDENKLNNTVSNLEWCDRKYNTNYGTRGQKIGLANKYRSKISSKDIEKMSFMRDNGYRIKKIAQMFGISESYTYVLTNRAKRGDFT